MRIYSRKNNHTEKPNTVIQSRQKKQIPNTMKNLQEQTFDLLEKTGLNWTVTKQPLQTASGVITESFGIIKGGANPSWLGTVGKQYETFQNFEMAELLLQTTNGVDLQITKGGELKGGRKTFMQVALDDAFIGKSNVKRYISALNSHDGSTSVGFGSTNTNIICENTFHMAYGDMGKIKHTGTMKERLDVMMKNLRHAIGLDEKLMDNFKRMADLQLKDEAVERVINAIFAVNKNTPVAEISTRKENQVRAFAGSLETSIKEQGSTIWALFNGVTRYTNHIVAPQDEAKKTDFLLTTGGLELSNTGYNEIMKWVEENTAELVYVNR